MKLLRAAMLALLVLGIMVRPMLEMIGELHAVEHAALIGDNDPQGNQLDPDHTMGTHGLLHQSSGNADSTLPAPLSLTAPPSTPVVLPVHTARAPGGAYITLPFRPPIA